MSIPIGKEAKLTLSEDELIEFWSMAKKVPSDCLVWQKGKDRQGYGVYSRKKKVFKAHRIAYYLEYGAIPKGKIICHQCDSPPCINPKHLFAGTYKQNTHDALGKKRMATGCRNGAYTKPESRRSGSTNGRSILSEEDVLDIRLTFATTRISMKELSRQYKVSDTVIGKIITRRLWNHVC